MNKKDKIGKVLSTIGILVCGGIVTLLTNYQAEKSMEQKISDALDVRDLENIIEENEVES